MYIVIITSLIALLLTYLDSIGKANGGMKWGFILVTFLGVIHYNYGNDYMSYYNIYQLITEQEFNVANIMSGEVFREPGWTFINYLFNFPGGFYVMVAVLNIIENIIIYHFIQREVSKEWHTLAVFVYLFSMNYYLMSFSMMRQWFVICVFLGLWQYIKRKKWWIAIIVLLACRLVHSSSSILIPFAFWGFLPVKYNKTIVILFGSLVIALWVSGSWVSLLLENTVMLTETDKLFEMYQDSGENFGSFGLGAFIQLIPLFVGLYYLLSSTDDSISKKQLVLLSLIGFAIAPLNKFVALGRVGLYFSFFQIATVPLIYSNIRNRSLRYSLLGLMVLLKSYDYILFFSNPVWVQHYSKFHTIFELL